MNLKELDDFYQGLIDRTYDLSRNINKLHGGYDYRHLWLSNASWFDETGQERESVFPLPVVEVFNICQFQISSDRVLVVTKLKRNQVRQFDFDILAEYHFKFWNNDHFTVEYSSRDYTIEEISQLASELPGQAVRFSLELPMDFGGEAALKFVRFLDRNGFYY